MSHKITPRYGIGALHPTHKLTSTHSHQRQTFAASCTSRRRFIKPAQAYTSSIAGSSIVYQVVGLHTHIYIYTLYVYLIFTAARGPVVAAATLIFDCFVFLYPKHHHEMCRCLLGVTSLLVTRLWGKWGTKSKLISE